MIFVNGFVHCDPHPGNVLVRKRPGTGKAEIVLLDHGLYQVGEAFPTGQPRASGPAWDLSSLNSQIGHRHGRQIAGVDERGHALPLEPSFCVSHIIQALSSQMRLVTPPSQAAVGSGWDVPQGVWVLCQL